MNKDQVAERIVGTEALQQQGKVEQLSGKLRAGYGDLKQEVAKAIKA